MLEEIDKLACKYITANVRNKDYENGKIGNPFSYIYDEWKFLFGLIDGKHYNGLIDCAKDVENVVECYIKSDNYDFSKEKHDKFLWYIMKKTHKSQYYIERAYNIMNQLIDYDEYDNEDLVYARFILKMIMKNNEIK